MTNAFHLVCCFLMLACSLNGVEGKTCYTELGCFYTSGYPSSDLPKSRNEVGTKFALHTRRNKRAEPITAADSNSIRNSNFESGNLTKFIIHGFEESSSEAWVTEMYKTLLNEGDYNVVVVDWSKGSGENVICDYGTAAGNSRIVGAEIAHLIRKIKSTVGISLEDVHLIGFSLGAHAAGYAGKSLNGEVGRISGLDPAGRDFEDIWRAYGRLDRTDAVFVDVIHTEITLVGLERAVGDIDFYVNNGEDQTGCPGYWDNVIDEGVLDAAVDSYACDHKRAAQYFTASIDNQNKFFAYSCSSYSSYIRGNCFACGSAGGCPRMGFHAERKHKTSQRLYLRTSAEKPYAAIEVKLVITMADEDSDGDSFKEEGELHIDGWLGSKRDSSYRMCLGHACFDDDQYFRSGRTYTFYTVVPQNLGELEGIRLFWDEYYLNSIFYTARLYIDKVQVIGYPTAGESVTMCGSSTGIKPERAGTFTKRRC